jgi:hypothetical protein
MTFAPDALAQIGGYPGTEDEARGMFGRSSTRRRPAKTCSPPRPF